MAFCWHCGGNTDEPNHDRRCDGQQGRIEAEFAALKREYLAHEHARTTDPDTSLAAAHRVADVAIVKGRVQAIVTESAEHGVTDEEITARYNEAWHTDSRSLESRSSPRKRRSDLTREGIVVDSGERRLLSSGRMGVVWKLAKYVKELVG